jgi:hypothetical protein
MLIPGVMDEKQKVGSRTHPAMNDRQIPQDRHPLGMLLVF